MNLRSALLLPTVALALSVVGCDVPVAFSGPTAESEEVVRLLRHDPATELAPPDGVLDEEESFADVGSGGPIVARCYRTDTPFEDVAAFYEAELPELGWSAGKDGQDNVNFRKQLDGHDASLFVVDGDKPCDVSVELDVAM